MGMMNCDEFFKKSRTLAASAFIDFPQLALSIFQPRFNHFTFTEDQPARLLSKSIALETSKRTLCAMDTNENNRLPDGPFTDFGQFGPGKIDLRVFLQSDYWVDIHGTGHLITSMSGAYRSKVVQMLLIKATALHMKILFLITGMIYEATLDRDAGVMESLQRNEIPLLYIEASYDFIENTLLMKRLRELVPNGPTLGDLLLQEIQKGETE